MRMHQFQTNTCKNEYRRQQHRAHPCHNALGAKVCAAKKPLDAHLFYHCHQKDHMQELNQSRRKDIPNRSKVIHADTPSADITCATRRLTYIRNGDIWKFNICEERGKQQAVKNLTAHVWRRVEKLEIQALHQLQETHQPVTGEQELRIRTLQIARIGPPNSSNLNQNDRS